MLKDKTIVITGAASGLGLAWVEGFLRDGANVLAADINAERLAAVQAMGAITRVVDVADAAAVKAMVEEAVDRTGRIDALFNNAGLAFDRLLEEAPEGAFERHVAVHLFGCVHGMRAALPHMRRQAYGRIINTISRNAETALPSSSAYAAAKAGIWAASRVAASELKGTDILVNMLIPGPTRTAIWGRDKPNLQEPQVTYPTAHMLATLPAGGPNGKVFWNEKEYEMFKRMES